MIRLDNLLSNDSNAGQKSVSIPDYIYESLVPLAEAANFKTVDEYVAFVLEEVARGDQEDMDAEQQEQVTERLRNLGYL